MPSEIYLAMFYGGMFLAGALFLVAPAIMRVASELRQIRKALERLELLDTD